MNTIYQKITGIKITYIIIAVLAITLVFLYMTRTVCDKGVPIINKEGYEANSIPNTTVTNESMASPNMVDSGDEIILYYATWCGYSRMFLPEWDKFEKYAKDNIPQLSVKKFRCEGGDENTCIEKGIKGYPMVILYPKNSTEIEFTKERSLDGLVTFVKENI